MKRRWDPARLFEAAREAGELPLPGGRRATDVDGLIEAHGHVLLIETKRAGTEVKDGQGQMGALEVVSRLGVTVLHQECDPPNEDAVTRYRVCRRGEWTPWRSATRLERDRWIRRWYDETKVEVVA